MINSRFEKLTDENINYFLNVNARLISNTQSSLWLHKSTHWIQSWWDAFRSRMKSEGQEAWGFVAQDYINEGLVPFGVLFLVREKRKVATFWISAGKLFGSPGPLISHGRESEFIDQLLASFKMENKYFFVDLAPTNEPWVLKNTNRSKSGALKFGIRIEESDFRDAPFIKLKDFYTPNSLSLSNHLARVKRNFIRDNRSISFQTYLNETADNELPSLYELHSLAWEKSIFGIYGGVYRDFFAQLNRKNAEISTRLDVLRIDGITAALAYGIVVNDRYYYLAPTYSKAFGSLSPGGLLLLEIICDLKSKNVEVFDFMNSLELYKLSWTKSIASRSKYIFYSHFFLSPNIIFFRSRAKAKIRIIINRT